jgi:sulfoxide reductase heme-binding subunit YedZ
VSVRYQAVLWNPAKRAYDFVLAAGALLYLALFIGLGAWIHPHATAETLLIRAFGTLALLLLHMILAIGPLCRLNPRFLPLLYNRRHLGVTMFCAALAHGAFSIVQFHALGDVHPLVSVFAGNTRFDSLAQFPFEALGFFALLILFLMAATSHDFWLNTLTAPVWKRLHMLVYAAYALLIGHVALGALQSETSPLLAGTLGAGMLVLIALHLAAGARERALDRERTRAAGDGFIEICRADEIPENRARIACLGGERVAVFRYGGKISAVGNVCRHQGGPLGEGRIIGGCITCPWHGYQYLPESGAAPPPFTEKVPSYRTRVVAGRVLVHPRPEAPGTRIEPASIA